MSRLTIPPDDAPSLQADPGGVHKQLGVVPNCPLIAQARVLQGFTPTRGAPRRST